MIGYIICGVICFIFGLAVAGEDVRQRETEAYRRGLRDGEREIRKMLKGDMRLP